MTRFTKLAAAVTFAVAGFAPAALAGPAWEFTGTGDLNTTGNFEFATVFTVNRDATVSGLGYFVDPVTGKLDASGNAVALYQCANLACSTTASLLASVTVMNTDPLTGHFRYATVSPINLVAGASYEVAGLSHGDAHVFGDSGFATDPALTILNDGHGNSDRWAFSTSLGFLKSFGTDLTDMDGIWGPNVFLLSVPEPASLALFGAGLAGLGLTRRRRAAQPAP